MARAASDEVLYKLDVLAGSAMLLLAALLDGGASESCEANFGQV